MPMPPSRSGVSNSSSRMHSSIYGSAMAPKPAASAPRPSSGGMRVGGAAKAFQAPVSNRMAAEDRIRVHGNGTRSEMFSASSTANGPAPVLQPAAGARPRTARSDENDRNGNLLSDGSVPMSPSVFSARSKQSAMPTRYGQAASPAAPPTPSDRQLLLPSQQYSQHDTMASGVSGNEYIITDISDNAAIVVDRAAPAPPAATAAAAAAARPPPTPPPPTPPPPTAPAAPSYAHNAGVGDYTSFRGGAGSGPASSFVPLELDAAAAASAVPAPPAPAAPPAPLDPAQAHLGKGVFAGVRMTYKPDGQVVAVKTYDHKEAREERAVAKHMHNEERLAGKLQHKNIIAPQAVTKADGKTQLEMEYAPGGSLEAYLKSLNGKPLAEEEARTLFRQVVDAVVYLHDKGICHRDIKLENIVLDAEGTCRLVDFGAAKEGGAETFLMSMQGTPAYMAPEVAMQKAHKGAPADVWALGVVLYNLISGGAFPFWGRNMDDLRRNIQAQPLRLPPHLSAACRDLITKLLQKASALRLTVHDVRNHPFLAEGAPPPERGHNASSQAAAWAAHAAHVPASPQRAAVGAAVSAEAANAAAAYRGELSAARAAAARRLQQEPEMPEKKHMGSPSRMAPQYQYASRNPITGGPACGTRPGTAGGSRPGTAGGSRPGTAGSQAAGGESPRSKLSGLMSGRGVAGTPIAQHRAASAAQLHQRPRPF